MTMRTFKLKGGTNMTTKRSILPAVLGLILGAGALAAEEPAPVDIQVTKDHIDFLAGSDLVARYQISPQAAKPYIWPLNGPNGVPITRAWPMEKGHPGESTDHPWQKSVWFSHGD